MRWIIALIKLFVFVPIIDWYVPDTYPILIHTMVLKNNEPTYHIEHTTTVIYDYTGRINYKIISDHINYFSEQQITCFNKIKATIFSKNKSPVWTIKADKAKLTIEKILYLYGHVSINSLTNSSQLKLITTDNAVVNLVTQEVFSNNKVTLHGVRFNSTGMIMRSNLRNKTAKLIKNVKTYFYES